MVKVLIVDDSPSRYKSVITRLGEEGISRSDIKLLSSSNEAEVELKAVQYDLLILDILIPAWPDVEADQQNSADLLFAIQNDDELLKPNYIVGITADKNAADDVLPEFEKNTWTVIQYSQTDDEWVGKILNCVNYLKAQGNAKELQTFDYDLAIICALPEPELEQITRLPWNWSPSKPLDDTTFFKEGHFEVGGQTYRVAAIHAPRMGMVSSAVASSKLIQLLRPKVLAMTGICAGHKSKSRLGDVLVADPAWDFQSGKLSSSDGVAKMEFSPHQISISPFLRSRFEQLANDRQALSSITEGFGSDAPSGFKMRVGPVASGAAVLSEGKVIDQIRQLQNRDLLGIEMEIYGVYAAALQASNPQPKFFAIKAVCDYADLDKHDGAQKFAAFASANVLRIYVEKFAEDLFGT